MPIMGVSHAEKSSSEEVTLVPFSNAALNPVCLQGQHMGQEALSAVDSEGLMEGRRKRVHLIQIGSSSLLWSWVTKPWPHLARRAAQHDSHC